jgi:hypothetical protein
LWIGGWNRDAATSSQVTVSDNRWLYPLNLSYSHLAEFGDVRFGSKADIGPKGNYPRLKNTKGFTQAEPKEQKFLWLNRSSVETRYHHVYSAIDSGFISSVRPDLASRIDRNG